MGNPSSNRRLAEALLKTLRHLEADTSVDPQDPAFIQLKCALLQRLLDLEVDTAEVRSSIHLVEQPEDEIEDAERGIDSAIA